MNVLNARVAVVTGAGRGIGREVALALARTGCVVAVVDLKPESAEHVAEEIRTQGGQASAHVVDVAVREQWERLVQEVCHTHGTAHILVNNAGVTVYGPFQRMSAREVDWLLDINIRGVLYGCHTFLPVLSDNDEAHIVNLSSMASMCGLPNQTTYSASKAAVRRFTGGLRIETARQNVGVTAVLPGAIATSFMDHAPTYDAKTSQQMSTLMQKYAVKPERVAQRIVRAIERNQSEVIIGPDSVLTHWVMGLMPALVKWGLRTGYGRYTNQDGTLPSSKL